MQSKLLLTNPRLNKIVQLMAFEYGYKWSGYAPKEVLFLKEKNYLFDSGSKNIYYNGGEEGYTLVTGNLQEIYDFFEYHSNVKVVLNKELTAIVSKDKITVGCQEFDISIIDKLVEARDKLNS